MFLEARVATLGAEVVAAREQVAAAADRAAASSGDEGTWRAQASAALEAAANEWAQERDELLEAAQQSEEARAEAVNRSPCLASFLFFLNSNRKSSQQIPRLECYIESPFPHVKVGSR